MALRRPRRALRVGFQGRQLVQTSRNPPQVIDPFALPPALEIGRRRERRRSSGAPTIEELMAGSVGGPPQTGTASGGGTQSKGGESVPPGSSQSPGAPVDPPGPPGPPPRTGLSSSLDLDTGLLQPEPGGGAAVLDKPNLVTMFPSTVPGDGWQILGEFAGPVILYQHNTICRAPLLFYPGFPPHDEALAFRGAGPGMAYLPSSGQWAVKYAATAGSAPLVLKIIDARNPGWEAWYLSQIKGACQAKAGASVVVLAASAIVLPANPFRTAARFQVSSPTAVGVEGIVLSHTSAATFAAGPPAIANGVLMQFGDVIDYSGDTNVTDAFHAIRTATLNIGLMVEEWTN